VIDPRIIYRVELHKERAGSRETVDIPLLVLALEATGCEGGQLLRRLHEQLEHDRPCWVLRLFLGGRRVRIVLPSAAWVVVRRKEDAVPRASGFPLTDRNRPVPGGFAPEAGMAAASGRRPQPGTCRGRPAALDAADRSPRTEDVRQ